VLARLSQFVDAGDLWWSGDEAWSLDMVKIAVSGRKVQSGFTFLPETAILTDRPVGALTPDPAGGVGRRAPRWSVFCGHF
jgi:hypothetical protein